MDEPESLMENFVIAKAIGFVLAGMLIALFSDRRALFWGGTLVASAFIGYNDPVWGVVTFVQLAVGWVLGRWLLASARIGRDTLADFWSGLTRKKRSPDLRGRPHSEEFRLETPPPRIATPTRIQPIMQDPEPPQRGFGVAGSLLVGVFLFAGGFAVAQLTKAPQTSSEVVVSDRVDELPPSSSQIDVHTDTSETVTEAGFSAQEPTLYERALAFLHDGRVITKTDILPTAEFLFVTSPIEGDPRVHRLFVIDCQSGAYARNAESLELVYLSDVIEMLMQGEPFTTTPFTPEEDGSEARALFDLACT